MNKKSVFHVLSVCCMVPVLAALTMSACGNKKYDALRGDAGFCRMAESVMNGTVRNPDITRSWPSDFDGLTLQEAIDGAEGGENIQIENGTYEMDAPIEISDIHGTSENYLTLSAAPGGRVILKGAGAPACFRISGSSFIRISGITIKDFSDPESVQAFDIEDACSHIVIDRCDISGICVDDPAEQDHCGNAILCYNSSDKVQDDILIADNIIHDCETGWSEAVSVDGNVENVNAVGNKISSTGNIGIDFAGNYGACPDSERDFARKCTAYGNRVYGCSSAYGDTAYGIYADGAHDVIIESNTVRKCDGGIEVGSEQPEGHTEDVTVKDNIIFNNLSDEFTVGGWKNDGSTGTVNNTRFIGNTIINTGANGAEGVITLSYLDGLSFESNTVVNLSGSEAVVRSFSDEYVKNVTWDDNIFIGKR